MLKEMYLKTILDVSDLLFLYGCLTGRRIFKNLIVKVLQKLESVLKSKFEMLMMILIISQENSRLPALPASFRVSTVL